jgi:hypothetical protein
LEAFAVHALRPDSFGGRNALIIIELACMGECDGAADRKLHCDRNAVHPLVIARLDRAIQYAAASLLKH